MAEERVRSLLLLDADADERRLISAVASRAGWSAVGAADCEMANALLQGPHGREVQAVLLGAWDDEASPKIIAKLREQRERLPIIVLGHGDSVSVAVDAMRAGASDFLVRPVAPERLLEALAANADRRKGAGELAPVSEKLAPELSLEQLIGAAPEFRASLAVAAKAARNRLPILIIGEPGTGKETVARAIHAASLRAKGPLLELDCKAVPANIIDSELFGHEKGAFPGAFAPKVGKLVQADGGTLLLDEVGALPPETQERLDRVLATGEVRPVGLNGSYSIDVRVIATCSRPLPDDFNPGLAERIGTTTVNLPPLRERPARRKAREIGPDPVGQRQLGAQRGQRPNLHSIELDAPGLDAVVLAFAPGQREVAGFEPLAGEGRERERIRGDFALRSGFSRGDPARQVRELDLGQVGRKRRFHIGKLDVGDDLARFLIGKIDPDAQRADPAGDMAGQR